MKRNANKRLHFRLVAALRLLASEAGRYIFMKTIKASLIILLGYTSFCFAGDRFSILDDISKLLNEGKVNMAVELIMKEDKKVTEAGAYRTIGTFYRKGHGIKKDNKKAIFYYGKGCELGDYHSCREKGVMFYKEGNYSDAEKIFLATAKNHKDFASMGSLVDLYRTKSWSGASEEKRNTGYIK